MTVATLGFCLALLAMGGGASAEFDDAMQAIDEGKYPIAFRELLPIGLAGHAEAQFELGFLYIAGRGVIKDDAMAAKWWLLSAEQGHLTAAFNIARLYSEGNGLKMDKPRAYMWFRVITEQSQDDDLSGWATEALTDLIENMTPEQVADGQLLLQARLPSVGLSASTFDKAAALYQSGDLSAGFTAFMTLAEAGNPAAQSMVAAMYLFGDGTQVNTQLGVQWYREAADSGFPPAQYNLGTLYARGEGVQKNLAEAARLLRLAAESGHTLAQIRLGDMLFYGEGIVKNLAEAAHWYQFSAEQGNGEAQMQLGFMYAKGEGVPWNLVRAYMWMTLSAEQGTQQAAFVRDELEKMMTDNEVMEAKRRASNWRPEN